MKVSVSLRQIVSQTLTKSSLPAKTATNASSIKSQQTCPFHQPEQLVTRVNNHSHQTVPITINTSNNTATIETVVNGSKPHDHHPDGSNTQFVKPYSEVPSPKGLPLIGTVLDYIKSGGGKNLHEYVRKRHSELGPIYK